MPSSFITPLLPLLSTPPPATVAYLLQASLSLDEGLAHLLLQLMNMAISGAPPKSSATEPDPQRDQDDGEAKEQTKDDKQSSKSDKKHQGGKGSETASSEDVKSQSPPANEGQVMCPLFHLQEIVRLCMQLPMPAICYAPILKRGSG